MGKSYLGRNFVENQSRSQSTDYGSSMGKKKSPSRAMAYTFPEMESFHQGTFSGSTPGSPGGSGAIAAAGNPCDGRVLWVQSQITIPCGESEFGIKTLGAVGGIKVEYPEGVSGNKTNTKGSFEECPTEDFYIIKVTDDCPGYSTITVWPEACPCTGFGVTCGAAGTVCGGSVPCYSMITPGGTKQFSVTAGTGTVAWSVDTPGWTVDSTGLVTAPTCSGSLGSGFHVVDDSCCSVDLALSIKNTFTLSGLDAVTKPGTYGYSASGAYGTVAWTVAGTGATIDQNGTVTLDSSACGSFTVTATDDCNGCAEFTARITNSGLWCLVSVDTCSTNLNPYFCCQCVPQAYNCTVTSGGGQTLYVGYKGCWIPGTPCGNMPGGCDQGTCGGPCSNFEGGQGCGTVCSDLKAVWNTKYNYVWSCAC